MTLWDWLALAGIALLGIAAHFTLKPKEDGHHEGRRNDAL